MSRQKLDDSIWFFKTSCISFIPKHADFEKIEKNKHYKNRKHKKVYEIEWWRKQKVWDFTFVDKSTIFIFACWGMFAYVTTMKY